MSATTNFPLRLSKRQPPALPPSRSPHAPKSTTNSARGKRLVYNHDPPTRPSGTLPVLKNTSVRRRSRQVHGPEAAEPCLPWGEGRPLPPELTGRPRHERLWLLTPHPQPHRLIWGFLADQRGNILMGSVKMGIFSTGPRKQVTSASSFSHLARVSSEHEDKRGPLRTLPT